MTDRAIPFTLSIKSSILTRLERVLSVAASQGRLHGDPNKTNRLATELLIQAMTTLEQEYAAQGLLHLPFPAPQAPQAGLPIAPATYAAALPLPTPSGAPLSAANDPAYRAQLRAAHDASAARLTGAAHTPVSLAELEAQYRNQGTLPQKLEAPSDIDWERVP